MDLQLFYDRNYAILLRAHILVEDGDNQELDLNFRLTATNLNLEFLAENQYWSTFKRNFLIISLSSIGGISIVVAIAVILKKRKLEKKQKILDQI